MQIKRFMTQPAITVHETATMNIAARLMWDHDTGMLPVVNDDGLLVGAITDRDICMSAYINGTLLDALPVTRAMTREVESCSPDDTIALVEDKMGQHQVRRLPVVDSDGRPVGVVSINDLALYAVTNGDNGTVKSRALAFAKVMASIGKPRTAPRPSKRGKPATKKPVAQARS